MKLFRRRHQEPSTTDLLIEITKRNQSPTLAARLSGRPVVLGEGMSISCTVCGKGWIDVTPLDATSRMFLPGCLCTPRDVPPVPPTFTSSDA